MDEGWEDALAMAEAIYDAGSDEYEPADERDLDETAAAPSQATEERAAAKGSTWERAETNHATKKSRCAQKNARRRARQKNERNKARAVNGAGAEPGAGKSTSAVITGRSPTEAAKPQPTTSFHIFLF